MKTHNHTKMKGSTRVSNQQAVYELKHRVVLALNKLADRDTYQIAVEELEKTIECLSQEGLAPFLSCILDTDSEQKSAVRKECIRLIGALATFHEGLIGSHLGKMVASIVKRLKDPDSVVRDACVETVGVLASKLSAEDGENDGVFVVLVKPLFEALGEQNKQVQFGAALCLARVIDNTHYPPVSILQRMLGRTVKMLKNPHFMAKPALIELNRSIIQAGGASTHGSLSAAMTSIQEALKNSDWTTRKAASAALGEIASGRGSFFGSFKSSCIQSLETCRFDKVKPVRDTALQALHAWQGLPRPDTPEPSEAGSSIKENFCGGDYGEISMASECTLSNVKHKKAGLDVVRKRVPLSVKKTGQNYVDGPYNAEGNDWHIDIAVPKSHNVSKTDVHNEESEDSSVTKICERSSTQEIGYELMDDKQECSSVSNHFSTNFERKVATISCDGFEKHAFVKPIDTSQHLTSDDVSTEEKRYVTKMQDRRSLDSTVTELSSHTLHGCCVQTANEMNSIRKQLLEIENKQAHLLDMLKVFTSSTMDSLSMIQMKVSTLENAVDRMAQDLVQRGKHSELAATKILKKSSAVGSPRLSTYTPRPSVDIHNRQPPLLPPKNIEVFEEKTFARCRSLSSSEQRGDMWTDPTVKLSRKTAARGIRRSYQQGAHGSQMRKSDAVFAPASASSSSENMNSPWKVVKCYMSKGDLNSAYVEALCSNDELVLIELLDRTGPVLESLSQKTANDILTTMASFFLEQRFMNSIIPWLQQVVDLTTIHGPNYFVLSAKTRQDFLYSIQEAVNMEYSNPAERRLITQLAAKLHQIWGKYC